MTRVADQTPRWRIRGARLITMDPDRGDLTGDLEVAGSRIHALGSDLGEPEPTTRVLDRPGWWVLPGFVQAHIHLCQSLLRGTAEDRPLDRWLAERIWPLEAAHDPESMAASARLGVAESLLAGSTTLLDMGSVHHTDVIGEVAREMGIRIVLGKALMDTGERVPPALVQDTATALREALGVHDRWDGAADGRVRGALAPRFTLSVSEPLWKELAAAARARGAPIHTHVSETPWENETCRAMHGDDPIGILARWGVFEVRTILVHAIWIDRRQQEALARCGAGVVHCPGSNAKLGSGTADVVGLRAAGVPVGLGSDAAACNDALSVVLDMRLAAQMQSLRAGPGALPIEETLVMATREGARVVGLEREVGTLAAGRRADLILFRDEDLAWDPQSSAAHRLALATGVPRPREVVVDGRFLVRDGALVDGDLERIRAQATTQREALLARANLSG